MEMVRAALVDALNEVPNIGIVHAYERYSNTLTELAALYMTGEVLLGWFVTRGQVVQLAPFAGRRVEQTTWHFTGYRGFVDATATELEFDALVDNIRLRFRTAETFGGAVPWIDDKAGIQVDETSKVLFAGILCHCAKLSLPTTRYLNEG